MGSISIEYYDLNYSVVLRDYMRYLQGFGIEVSEGDVRDSEDFKRILAIAKGRRINTIPYVTWGQSLSGYFKNKIDREMNEMEELARVDALRLREWSEPVVDERR